MNAALSILTPAIIAELRDHLVHSERVPLLIHWEDLERKGVAPVHGIETFLAPASRLRAGFHRFSWTAFTARELGMPVAGELVAVPGARSPLVAAREALYEYDHNGANCVSATASATETGERYDALHTMAVMAAALRSVVDPANAVNPGDVILASYGSRLHNQVLDMLGDELTAAGFAYSLDTEGRQWEVRVVVHQTPEPVPAMVGAV